MKTNNKGFSLVELIVVIAIMAILAAVAIPTFSAFINKANVASDDSFVADITYACEIAFATEGEVTSVDVKGAKDASWSTITVVVKPAVGDAITYTITNAEPDTFKVGSADMEGTALKCAQDAVATIDGGYTFKTATYAPAAAQN